MAKKPAKAKKPEVEGLSVDELMNVLNQKHGAGSVRMGETAEKIDAISTGALTLDLAIGVGGIPRGRITEIYGPESSGKTTLTLQVAANAQKAGGRVAFIDVEHALDPTYAAQIGVNMDTILISQPDSGEQALDIVETLCESGQFALVIVDSVAALVPKAELEGNMGDHHVGAQARLLSQGCRKLKGIVNTSKTALIFINQLREKIGVMFGNPETTSGGRALKFYSSVRIDIRRVATIKKEESGGLGNHVRTKIVKNKVAPPFRQAEFDIIFGKGISRAGCILDKGVEDKLIGKNGSHFTYNNIKLGNGRVNAVATLEANPEMMEEIENKVLNKDVLFDSKEAELEEENKFKDE